MRNTANKCYLVLFHEVRVVTIECPLPVNPGLRKIAGDIMARFVTFFTFFNFFLLLYFSFVLKQQLAWGVKASLVALADAIIDQSTCALFVLAPFIIYCKALKDVGFSAF
jgi:hypothetical protein